MLMPMSDQVFRAAARAKSELSVARRTFVEWMQDLPFCQFRNIEIRNGEPVLDPRPTITREIKFGADERIHGSRAKEDFFLKQQHVELFTLFDQIGTGTIQSLDVKAGLPFRVFLVTT